MNASINREWTRIDANKRVNFRSFAAHRLEVSDRTHRVSEIHGPNEFKGANADRLQDSSFVTPLRVNRVYGFSLFFIRVYSRPFAVVSASVLLHSRLGGGPGV